MSAICFKCKAKTNKNSKTIYCELCKHSYHSRCTSLSEELYRIFLNNKDITWTCDECKIELRATREKYNEVLKENSILKSENSTLKSRLTALENTLKDLKSELKQEILEELNQGREVGNSSLYEDVASCIREERERTKRRLNLCIRNFPELDGDDEAIDQPTLLNFMGTQLDLPLPELTSGISQFKRLGEKTTNRSRNIILTCNDFQLKKRILQNKSKLKNYRTNGNKKVFIEPDLTRTQIGESIKLREELWTRRNNGEAVVIRAGKIVSTNSANVSRRPLRRNHSENSPREHTGRENLEDNSREQTGRRNPENNPSEQTGRGNSESNTREHTGGKK